ncbi:Imm1 family immunity protein [Solwaraspora sp. WMMD1047]|uniref:Imm1 family immunity protein n=1 Tax=Solwaraspora sp. WMMD1047 TaxID=3016102 RepID=UPI0024175249|nr:Imm1 family immunity protein [Solwaraspora sp. WMMD1047]MDG4834856.1 Imm1 family immunity protein [Solwaraspora sp. WMMD1047]
MRSVEFGLQAGNDRGPILARSAAEVDAAFARLLAAAPLLHNPTVFIRERPRIGPAGIPDHGLKLDLRPSCGVGAMSYFGDPADGCPGPWVTRAVGPVPPGVVLYRDIDSASRYPADAAVPLAHIRRALNEFCAGGGRRPATVAWQQATTW